MKKLVLSALAVLSLASCYDDYIKDYDYSSISFAQQINTRTVVIGEGQKIKFGAMLSGVMKNNSNRKVLFELDNSLITPQVLEQMKKSSTYIKNAVSGVEKLKPMPEGYVTFSNDEEIVIPKGDHFGTISVTATDRFIADPASIKATYVLPFRIVSADADSVNQAKNTSLIGLHYEHMLFGTYLRNGVTKIVNAQGQEVQTQSTTGKNWTLKTVSPNSLVTSLVENSRKGSMKITLQGEKILISPVDGSEIQVTPEGESTYNNAKLLQERKLFLKYKFSDKAGNTYHVSDTLSFEHRIRDGVKEWQDENPEHYR